MNAEHCPACYTVTLRVRVHDADALRAHAEARAKAEGLKVDHWRRQRTGIDDDLVMIFDPGSVPGADVLETTAE